MSDEEKTPDEIDISLGRSWTVIEDNESINTSESTSDTDSIEILSDPHTEEESALNPSIETRSQVPEFTNDLLKNTSNALIYYEESPLNSSTQRTSLKDASVVLWAALFLCCGVFMYETHKVMREIESCKEEMQAIKSILRDINQASPEILIGPYHPEVYHVVSVVRKLNLTVQSLRKELDLLHNHLLSKVPLRSKESKNENFEPILGNFPKIYHLHKQILNSSDAFIQIYQIVGNLSLVSNRDNLINSHYVQSFMNISNHLNFFSHYNLNDKNLNNFIESWKLKIIKFHDKLVKTIVKKQFNVVNKVMKQIAKTQRKFYKKLSYVQETSEALGQQNVLTVEKKSKDEIVPKIRKNDKMIKDETEYGEIQDKNLSDEGKHGEIQDKIVQKIRMNYETKRRKIKDKIRMNDESKNRKNKDKHVSDDEGKRGEILDKIDQKISMDYEAKRRKFKDKIRKNYETKHGEIEDKIDQKIYMNDEKNLRKIKYKVQKDDGTKHGKNENNRHGKSSLNKNVKDDLKVNQSLQMEEILPMDRYCPRRTAEEDNLTELSGQWFLELGRHRSASRTENSKTDWIFERARARRGVYDEFKGHPRCSSHRGCKGQGSNKKQYSFSTYFKKYVPFVLDPLKNVFN